MSVNLDPTHGSMAIKNTIAPVLIRAVVACAVSFCAVGSVQAQSIEQRVTLEQALDRFVTHSFAVRLARSRSDEAAALAVQSAAYPNPAIQLTHEPLSGPGASVSETYINIHQSLEWPGYRQARIGAARRLADAARFRYEADSLQHTLEVIEAYAEAAFAESRYNELLQVAELFREAARSAEEQYATGEESGYYLRRLRVERMRYENRLELAAMELREVRTRFSSRLSPSHADTLFVPAGVPEPVEAFTFDDAMERAKNQRADLAAVRTEAEAAQLGFMQRRKERLPAPALTAGYKQQSNDFRGPYIGLALDIPVWDRKTGSIAAQTARIHQAETRFLLTEIHVEHDVRLALDLYTARREHSARLQSVLLDESDALLQAARASYAEGEIGLIELLDAANAYSEAHMMVTESQRAVLMAYYQVLRSTGSLQPF
jgi:outer membrane protein, heavy metal efflux system